MSRTTRLSQPMLLALTSALVAGQVARAADAPAGRQTEATRLQEVIVTATKRHQRLLEVPMGVTAITGNQLQREQLVDFADLETQVPGLSV